MPEPGAVRRIVRALALGALLAAGPARAAEFRSVDADVAVLYDAPSKAATPILVVSRYYPLEVIVNLESWAKVRDSAGTLSWIEKQLLSPRRMVLVTAPTAAVHAQPADDAPVVFVAAQNVVLELIEIAPDGWLRVRHADGSTGYVRSGLVWGGG